MKWIFAGIAALIAAAIAVPVFMYSNLQSSVNNTQQILDEYNQNKVDNSNPDTDIFPSDQTLPSAPINPKEEQSSSSLQQPDNKSKSASKNEADSKTNAADSSDSSKQTESDRNGNGSNGIDNSQDSKPPVNTAVMP